MTWLGRGLPGLAVLLAALMLWVRLAPSDPARWNVDPRRADHAGGAYVRFTRPGGTPAAILAALDRIAQTTPRTERLAGSPDEGRITWVTRTAFWGFPDYTTAEASETGGVTELTLFARQRFGRKDFGVNAARLRDWMGKLVP